MVWPSLVDFVNSTFQRLVFMTANEVATLKGTNVKVHIKEPSTANPC